MKYMLLGGLMLLDSLFAVSGTSPVSLANAQGSTQMVNCAGLKGLPALCFKNNSQAPILKIVTSNSMAFGADAINTNIPPGFTYIIQFPSSMWGGCSKFMKVFTADGKEHNINGGRAVDVCNNTTVNVSW